MLRPETGDSPTVFTLYVQSLCKLCQLCLSPKPKKLALYPVSPRESKPPPSVWTTVTGIPPSIQIHSPHYAWHVIQMCNKHLGQTDTELANMLFKAANLIMPLFRREPFTGFLSLYSKSVMLLPQSRLPSTQADTPSLSQFCLGSLGHRGF